MGPRLQMGALLFPSLHFLARLSFFDVLSFFFFFFFFFCVCTTTPTIFAPSWLLHLCSQRGGLGSKKRNGEEWELPCDELPMLLFAFASAFASALQGGMDVCAWMFVHRLTPLVLCALCQPCHHRRRRPNPKSLFYSVLPYSTLYSHL